MTCKGTCQKYKSTAKPSGGLYRNGIKKCQICAIYINWEGSHCTWCGYMLRSKPRNRHFKAKLTGDVPRIE